MHLLTTNRQRPAALVLAASWFLACGGGNDAQAPGKVALEERLGPATAVWSVVDAMREDVTATRHPADGGGRAWLERPPGAPEVVARTPGRFLLTYEVGPKGIATGGAVILTVSPFWGWSTPQSQVPDAPGYTIVTPSADDIELDVETIYDQTLAAMNTGRALAPGERITFDYGAGALGAMVDRYAEDDSRFWFSVDGDGDGIRATLADSPGIAVRPREAVQLRISAPTTVRPGDEFIVVAALLDATGNTGTEAAGEVRFTGVPAGFEIPARVAIGTGGRATVRAVAHEPGVYRIEGEAPGDLRAESNPIVVGEGPRVLWADLHGHTALSDGTGTPDAYFRYARDVSALDVVALTDHDHWGVLHLDQHPEIWDEIRSSVLRFHDPGRFVTILGYEWTSWIHGHRHVLYFEDTGEIYSSIDPDYETPTQLWRALEGSNALTFAHHSAGGPIATDWSIAPDPRFEPVTEIVSVHGSSEALDSPGVIYSPVPGNFVRDVLDRGIRFGFVGSGDGHDGHPGFTQVASSSGGLAAILSEDRTREGVLAALRARRTYATNGPRILLRFAIGENPMGTTIPVPLDGEAPNLFIRVVAPQPLERIELIRSGEITDTIALEGRREVALERPVEALRSGEYLYIRAVQEDGGAAWSSPIFVE